MFFSILKTPLGDNNDSKVVGFLFYLECCIQQYSDLSPLSAYYIHPVAFLRVELARLVEIHSSGGLHLNI